MKKTVQPRKQRLRMYNTPLHARGKRIASPLSKELREKYGKRSIPLRVGDTVVVLRGNFKGHKEKVTVIDRKAYRVYVKGVVNKKANGDDAPRPVNASNLRVVELVLDDKKREKMITRK
ncbi:50S ribosomal protein L24 [archaeon]